MWMKPDSNDMIWNQAAEHGTNAQVISSGQICQLIVLGRKATDIIFSRASRVLFLNRCTLKTRFGHMCEVLWHAEEWTEDRHLHKTRRRVLRWCCFVTRQCSYWDESRQCPSTAELEVLESRAQLRVLARSNSHRFGPLTNAPIVVSLQMMTKLKKRCTCSDSVFFFQIALTRLRASGFQANCTESRQIISTINVFTISQTVKSFF